MTAAQIQALLTRTSEAVERLAAELNRTDETDEDVHRLHALAQEARNLSGRVAALKDRQVVRSEKSSERADELEALETQLIDLADELERFQPEDEEE